MSRVWGREETTGWPTRQPAFTITALLVAVVSVVAVWCYRYEFEWTPLERYWYPAFANMHLMGMIGAKTGTYQLLEVENARGLHRLAVGGREDDALFPKTVGGSDSEHGKQQHQAVQ